MKLWCILFLSILFYACETKSDCPNANSITMPAEQDVRLKLNYNQTPAELSKDVENLFKEDLCWKEKVIGLELKEQVIKTIFLKTCPLSIINHRAFPKVEILMNRKGETMLNYQIIKLDSISDWIGENFPDELNLGKKEISFRWEKESPREKIEATFEQIWKGYLKSYDLLAKDLFKKEFCKLDEKELEKIKDSLDFRVKLGFGKIHIPPPPPSIEERSIK